MKPGSIFDKFHSSEDEIGVRSAEVREFVAEQLESRILYSAAPVAIPVADGAQEGADPSAMGSDFESIETFLNASKQQSVSADSSSEAKVLILTSFEPGIESPVVFESISPSFRVWQESGGGAVAEAVADPSEYTVVSLDPADGESPVLVYEVQIGESSAADGVYVDYPMLMSGEIYPRFTAIRSTDGDHCFGMDFLSVSASVFGLDHIESTFTDAVRLAA
ncbi:MAG: LEPR-XLL domain-containing protein [Verrucomicrobiales bacterium]|nr:LEPR-XLL domain-containing protein [Verrucomicrobiales bacterium]